MGSRGALDPIFQQEERVERATPRSALLFQFFLFPLLIVVASVGVFLFFGAIGGAEKSPSQYLEEVVSGGGNEQKQAAQQLGVALEKERRRVESGEIPLAKAFYVADAGFRAKLGQAFESSSKDRSLDRQVFLALALGFVGDPDYRAALEARLAATSPVELRRAVAQSLGRLSSDEVVPALVRASSDPDEPVRNLAVVGLSRHPTSASLESLKTALADPSVFVRISAAGALALQGDATGKDLVANLLDPAWVERTVAFSGGAAPREGGDAPADQRAAQRANAISNGIRAALALRAQDLRPKVEALRDDPDPDVRRLAREALDQWSRPR